MNAKSSISSAIEIAPDLFKARNPTATCEPAPGNPQRVSADGCPTGPSVRCGIAQRLGDEGRRDQVVGIDA